MSVRARLNLVWVITLVWVLWTHALIFYFRSPGFERESFGTICLISEIAFLLYTLGKIKYWDLYRLTRPRRGRFAPDLLKVPANRPPWFYFHSDDSPREYYLLSNYAEVCVDSDYLAVVAAVAFLFGGPFVVSNILMGFAYLCLFYIIWRLNTCWANLYLG